MAEYGITIKPSAAKELDRLPDSIAARAERKIAALASEPRPSGVKKLKGEPERWRLRIGDWRTVAVTELLGC